MKLISRMFLSLLLLNVFVFRVHAVEFKQGETVTVAKNESIGSTLFAGGNSVVIDGVVHGDIFCAGKEVTITGTVDGDVLCAAQELKISGTVSGNLRIAGQTIALSGTTNRSATMFAQMVTIDPKAHVVGDVIFGSQTFTQNGTVGSLTGWVDSLKIRGKVNGPLQYTSDNEVQLETGAFVSGPITRAFPQQKEKESKPAEEVQKTMRPWPSNALAGVLFYLLLSFLVSAVFPKKAGEVADIYESRGAFALIIGMIGFITLPIIVLSLLVTIVGILLIPIPVLVAIVLVSFGRIVGAQVFGKAVLEGFGVKNASNVFIQSLIGVPILWFMFKAPYVGGLFTFISIILGLGTVLLSFQKSKK